MFKRWRIKNYNNFNSNNTNKDNAYILETYTSFRLHHGSKNIIVTEHMLSPYCTKLRETLAGNTNWSGEVYTKSLPKYVLHYKSYNST